MIITRTPNRITLGGGATDIPEFYEKYGGFWIAGAINKFVYVAIKNRFEKELRLSYSNLEIVDDNDKVKHPILREALKEFEVNEHTEIVTFADIPGGTGLGSSGSFTVGLLNALSIYTNKPVKNLAELAFDIERNRLSRPIGKQDQYSALFGGVRVYKAKKNGTVFQGVVESPELEDNLSLFYTKIKRNSKPLLDKVKNSHKHLLRLRDIGEKSLHALEDGDYISYGRLLDKHWEIKRSILPDSMSNTFLDMCYMRALNASALGGKLIGAGGGGFFMFLTVNEDDKQNLHKEMRKLKLPHIPFKFHNEGTRVIEI